MVFCRVWMESYRIPKKGGIMFIVQFEFSVIFTLILYLIILGDTPNSIKFQIQYNFYIDYSPFNKLKIDKFFEEN